VKIAQVVDFLPGVDRGRAQQHWLGRHAALGAAVPGVRRYVQNMPTASLGLLGVDDAPTAFDGYSCVWFDDRPFLDAALKSNEWSAMDADAATFVTPDPERTLLAEVEERVIIDGPMGPFKAVWFVQFTADIRNDPQRTKEAHEYWTRTHGGAFGVRVPGIDRYVQNHVVAPVVADATLGYDGFSECWFQDRAAFDVTMASPEWSDMNADATTIFDRDWIVGGWSALLDEHVVRG
jgi:uncharacterized protein (TIGR02118 family)